jgi:hypothetical protein
MICKDHVNNWNSINQGDINYSDEMGEDDACRNDTISKYNKTKEVRKMKTMKLKRYDKRRCIELDSIRGGDTGRKLYKSLNKIQTNWEWLCKPKLYRCRRKENSDTINFIEGYVQGFLKLVRDSIEIKSSLCWKCSLV